MLLKYWKLMIYWKLLLMIMFVQVGLFRKSGVKSRILALREMNELNCNFVNYEGQFAFDVADMVKQYFRDLPEPIFTSKLYESFLHIYQCKILLCSVCLCSFSPRNWLKFLFLLKRLSIQRKMPGSFLKAFLKNFF